MTAAPASAGHNRLAELRDLVTARDATVRDAARIGIVAAIEAGAALIEAKQLVGHGGFGAWLRENVRPVSPRTARLYMALAANRATIEAKLATAASLTIREAARLVAGEGQRATRPRLLPPAGMARQALVPGDRVREIWIFPATVAGHFHLAYLTLPPVGGGELVTTKRPIAGEGLGLVERALGTERFAFTMVDSPCAPQAANPFDVDGPGGFSATGAA